MTHRGNWEWLYCDSSQGIWWNISWALRISLGLRQYFIVYPSSRHNTVTMEETVTSLKLSVARSVDLSSTLLCPRQDTHLSHLASVFPPVHWGQQDWQSFIQWVGWGSLIESPSDYTGVSSSIKTGTLNTALNERYILMCSLDLKEKF